MSFNKQVEGAVKSRLLRCKTKPTPVAEVTDVTEDNDEDDDEPFDMSWPKDESVTTKLIYLFLFVISFMLWITLPDMRRAEKQKYFAGCFIGSILWIGLFRSYTLVDVFAQQVIQLFDGVDGGGYWSNDRPVYGHNGLDFFGRRHLHT